jgi:hypothetical protein
VHGSVVATCVVDRNCSLSREHAAHNMTLKQNEESVIDLPPIVHASHSGAASGSSLDSESPAVKRGMTFGEGSGGMPITIQASILCIMLDWFVVRIMARPQPTSRVLQLC